jgi:hypothetical protein
MKPDSVILLIWCFIKFLSGFQPAVSQLPVTVWEKQIPVNTPHYFSDVLEIEDGRFILLGAIEMPEENGFDVWLLECNNMGDTVKTRVFSSPGNDIPMRITPMRENGYLVAFINILPGEGLEGRLMVIDTAFKKTWMTETDRESAILHSDVAVDPTGHIWWLNTFTGTEGKPLVSLWKLDEEGYKTEELHILENNPLAGYGIRLLPDGTMAIVCQVQPAESKPTVMVLKMDAGGKWLWKSLIPQPEKLLTPQCICCSNDNFLLVGGWAGMCWNPEAPAEDQVWDYDYLLTKLDRNGKIIWSQQYNREGSEKGTSLAVMPDGNIMAAGKCESSYTGTTGLWLLFVDKNGKIVKEEVTKFRFMKDQIARIIRTSDGGFLLVGPGNIESENKFSGWIKKLK